MGHRRAEHPRPDRADHQRRAVGSRAARQELAVARLVPAPVEVDGTVAQERPDDRERLLEPVDAVVVREAEGAELGLVPAGAEAEDEAAAADLVDRAACLASRAGLWKFVHATSGPSSIRLVEAAIADSSVQASHGPRAGRSGQR